MEGQRPTCAKAELIDRLAEVGQALAADVPACVAGDWLHGALTATDEAQAWVMDHALDEWSDFELLCATGDYETALAVARNRLIPALHDALAADRLERSSTPAEIRGRDPQAFEPLFTIPRAEVLDWMRGERRARAQRGPVGSAAAPSPRPAARAQARPRGAGRPRAVARASSRGGDSGDDGSGPADEPGPLARLARALRRALSGVWPWR